MFTGIVTDVGEVVSVASIPGGVRLRIATAYEPASIAVGASIACAGVCLTAVVAGSSGGRNHFEVEASVETLARTTLGRWTPGTRINLERALRLGDELGGHIVTGHVDGTARLRSREETGGMARMEFEAPSSLARFVATKGSVALDGTSLTVNDVAGDRFSVMLIPHTLAVTTWDSARPGDEVNLEVDMMARYVARLAEYRPPSGAGIHSS